MLYPKKRFLVLIALFQLSWSHCYPTYDQYQGGIYDGVQVPDSQKSSGINKRLIAFLSVVTLVVVAGGSIIYSALKRKPGDETGGRGGPNDTPEHPPVPPENTHSSTENPPVPPLGGNLNPPQKPKGGVFRKKRSVEKIIQEAIEKKGNAITVDLSNQDLTEIPEELKKVKNLRRFDLSGNSIKKLPEWMGNCENFYELSLNDYERKELPEGLTCLKRLKILEIQNAAKLKSLPHDIKKLEKLETLSLLGWKLDDLTDEDFENVVTTLEGFTQGEKLTIKYNSLDNKTRKEEFEKRLREKKIHLEMYTSFSVSGFVKSLFSE